MVAFSTEFQKEWMEWCWWQLGDRDKIRVSTWVVPSFWPTERADSADEVKRERERERGERLTGIEGLSDAMGTRIHHKQLR